MNDQDVNPYAPPDTDVSFPSIHSGTILPNDGPVGLGGWLILPMLGVILRPLGSLYMIGITLSRISRDGVWKTLTHPEEAGYHPVWKPLIIFELITNAILIALGILLAIHFFKKSAKAPRLYIFVLVAFPLIVLADMMLAEQIPNIGPDALDPTISRLSQSIVSACIWIPYFLNSKRVKNTFIH